MTGLHWRGSPGGAEFLLGEPQSLARTMRFDGTDPRWYDAPPAQSWPHRVDRFSGSVATGAG
ncbi:MAG: hypothetical protein RML32_09540, partial [Gammaproteobacteria bacterium]|nr:hypothetical protein [Gammaproteobacteria bacterium]